jgi:hypothetical protein
VLKVNFHARTQFTGDFIYAKRWRSDAQPLLRERVGVIDRYWEGILCPFLRMCKREVRGGLA